MGIFGDIYGGLKTVGGGIEHGISKGLNYLGLNGLTPGAQAQADKLNGVGAGAMGFAGQTQQNYNDLTGRLTGSLNGLQAIANGQNSVSAEQLRQGLSQQVAQQQAMAASANPNNAAMAARTAALNSARLGYGLSGQQAIAGLAERNQAQQAYASLLGNARGQDLQGTLGGYGTAAGAYGGGLTAQANAPTLGGSVLKALGAVATLGSK